MLLLIKLYINLLAIVLRSENQKLLDKIFKCYILVSKEGFLSRSLKTVIKWYLLVEANSPEVAVLVFGTLGRDFFFDRGIVFFAG